MTASPPRGPCAWLRPRHRSGRRCASGASWLMLAGSAACVIGCLVAPLDGAGRRCTPWNSSWRAGRSTSSALLLALVATAGMLPAFLDPQRRRVLLAKPVPRPALLAGKCLGVLAFVAFHASRPGRRRLAGAGGARAGAWDPTFLLCAPLLVLHFAVFFSFSAMLAVGHAEHGGLRLRDGAVLAALLGDEFRPSRGDGRPRRRTSFRRRSAGSSTPAYWVLPKPLDFQLALTDGSRDWRSADWAASWRGAWSPGLSLLASALCGAGLLGVAAYDFATAEY